MLRVKLFCNSLNGPKKERRENVNQIELQHQIKSNKSKWEIEAEYTTKNLFQNRCCS